MFSANQSPVMMTTDQSELRDSSSIKTEHKSWLFVSCIYHSLLSSGSQQRGIIISHDNANKIHSRSFIHLFIIDVLIFEENISKRHRERNFSHYTIWIELWLGCDKVISAGRPVTSFAFSGANFLLCPSFRPSTDWNWNSISQQTSQ